MNHFLLKVGSSLSAVITSIVFAPLIFWIAPLRTLLYRIDITSKWWKDKYALILCSAVIGFYAQLAIGLPFLAYKLFGVEHLFEGIVAAGLFIAFFAFQYPKIFPPNFAATFTTEDMKEKRFTQTLRAGQLEKIYFSIMNLGTVHLKNCGSSFEFEECFTVETSPKYRTKRKYIMQYKPDSFSMDLPACMSQQMFVCVKTPTQGGIYRVKCSLYSESTFGSSSNTLKLSVSNSD